MKKMLIGALVGGLLIFAWQTASFVFLELHDKGLAYTPKQDDILKSLNAESLPEGTYMLPRPAPGTPMDQHEAFMKNYEGKPWAKVSYYPAWKVDMTMNMIRGFLSNVIMVFLLCWILSKFAVSSFGTYFMATLFTGLIAFINEPYTGHIWYPMHDIMAYLIDAIVAWGLCGLWLGWWYSRKK